MIASGSLSSANTASSTALAILPWMRREASSARSWANLAGVRGPVPIVVPRRLRCLRTSAASHSAADCGSAPRRTDSSKKSARGFSSQRNSACASGRPKVPTNRRTLASGSSTSDASTEARNAASAVNGGRSGSGK